LHTLSPFDLFIAFLACFAHFVLQGFALLVHTAMPPASLLRKDYSSLRRAVDDNSKHQYLLSHARASHYKNSVSSPLHSLT